MNGIKDRKYWLDTMQRIIDPVLNALAKGELKSTMPIEGKIDDRHLYTHLEALGRTMAGIAPWLEGDEETGDEGRLKVKYRQLCRQAIEAAVDTKSPDYVNFEEGFQPIVDAAFLANAIIRAPRELWFFLKDETKKNLVKGLKATRTRKPWASNWLLFSAMIETALYVMGEEDWDPMRIDYALKQHEQWYLGDGVYGDGPQFHWDYYNSFVIQPMLVDIISKVQDIYPDWKKMKQPLYERAKRYADIQERFISPEGTFPVIGRSIVYRTGAFQGLAQAALLHNLADSIKPAQVRCALTAVIKKCLDVQGTFDEKGWLKIGLYGSQPDLGESYISTGSLYLCSTVFLTLGLPSSDEFWKDEDCDWSSKKIWSGENLQADHSI